MPASLCLACLFVAGFLLAQGQQTGPADVKVQGPCDVSKKISSPSGDMIAPRCTSNGYYEHQQCLGMQSQSMACWCADPFTGKAIANSIKTPPERPNCSNCILAVAKALHENITAGKFVPTCLESGDYASLQCQGSVSNCWCVNPTTGAELPGTRAKPGSPAPTCDQMSVPTNGGCLQKAAEATGRLGAFVPHCSSAGGHYHTMQCHEAYCFCVDPETGTEAPGTRIQAWEGRNAPCGPCHKRKFEILESRGSEKLPTCLSNGDYDDSSFMRCKALNATYSVCNCIDENGKEIPDTRAIQTPTFKPTCPIPDVTLPIDIRSAPTTVSSLNVSTTISSSPSHSSTSSGSSSSSSSSSSSTTTTRPTTSRFASATTTTDGGKKVTEVNEQKSIDSHPETVTKPTIALPVGHADCSLAKSAGTVCTTGQNKSSTQWYFDPANYDCMAFKHQGCGGNANRFNTVNECWTKCKMPDASGCAGQTAPAKGSDGTMTICRRPEECPTGYTCRMGAFFGTCCETKTEDLYTKNYRPTCKSGSEPVQVEAGGFEMPLLGKSCQDEFCPSGSECVQQEIFAHCCKLDGGKPSPSAEFQADSPTVNADGEKTPEDPYVERDEAQPTSTTSSPSTQKQSSSSSPVQHSPPVVKSPPILQQDVPSSSSTSNTSSSTPLTSESIDAQIATKPEEGSVIDVPPRGRTADCHGEKPAICEDGQLGWYLDKKVGSCVAAMFCSGAAEGNRFDTLPSCEGACYPADGSACYEDRATIFQPVNSAAAKRPSCNDLSACPAGYICKHGAFFGTCCNKTSEDIWARNWLPNCTNNLEVHKFAIPERDNYKQPLLGSSCSDKFCPKGTTCVQQEFFAHCCGEAAEKPDTPQVSLQHDAAIGVKPTPPEPQEVDWAEPDCDSVRDPGKCAPDSNQAPTQKFYFDTARGACMAFVYSGCGGNANLYDTRADCLRSCQTTDPPVCLDGLAKTPATVAASAQSCADLKCPTGFECSTGGVLASCCNITVTKLYRAANDDKCPDGSKAGGIHNGNFFEATYAESCSELLCDSEQECVQVNQLFAKCCAKDPNGVKQTDDQSNGLSNSTAKVIDASPTIAVSAPPSMPNCTAPKDSGKCEDGKESIEKQMYYYDHVWQACFVFKYSGCGGSSNRFSSADECLGACAPSDPAPCPGPNSQGPGTGASCQNLTCTAGYTCHQGWAFASCCNSTIDTFVEQGYGYQCPDGSQAGGVFDTENQYFKPTLAASCDDLTCRADHKCVQVNKYFAKCCGGPVISTPAPFTAPPPAGVTRDAENQTVSALPDVKPPPLAHDVGSATTSSFPPQPDCTAPKDSGVCADGQQKKEVQQFYYNEEWSTCFAFKYSGCGGNSNRFNTRSECEVCNKADGSVCTGPTGAHGTIVTGPNCQRTKCPTGFSCHYGFGYAECCNATLQEEQEQAYAYQCPDGRQASGVFQDYFQATFAQSCADLICSPDQQCVQVNRNYAKCCGGPVIVTPSPPPLPIISEATPTHEATPTIRGTNSSSVVASSTATTSKPGVVESLQADQAGSYDVALDAVQTLTRRQNCSRQQTNALMKCVEPLREFTGSNALMEIFPSEIQLGEIDETCAAFNHYISCVSKAISLLGNCYLYEADMIGIVLGYQCDKDTLRILKANRACMSDVRETPQVRMCEKTFNSTVDEGQQAQATGGSSDLRYFCTALDQLLACTQPQLVQCSTEAAQYMNRRIGLIKTDVFKDCASPTPSIDDAPGTPPTPSIDDASGTPPTPSIDDASGAPPTPSIDDTSGAPPTPSSNDLGTPPTLVTDDSDPLPTPSADGLSTPQSPQWPPIAGIGPVVALNDCPVGDVLATQQCAKDLLSDQSRQSIYDPDAKQPFVFTSERLSKLPDFCEGVSTYQQCVSAITDKSAACKANLVNDPHYPAINGIMSTICQPENQARVKQYGQCLADVSGNTNDTDCGEQLSEGVDSSQASQLCSASKQLSSCMESAVGKTCGADALEFLREIIEMITITATNCESTATDAPPSAPTSGNASNCKTAKEKVLANTTPGDYIPQCNDDGSYITVQCSGSKGECWCVGDDGKEVDGTRVASGETPTCGECNKERRAAIEAKSDLIPQCQEDGSFQPIQCHSSNGSCWCVHSLSGVAIEGSIVGPGQELPTCGMKEVFACEKKEWKDVCQPDGSKPQLVFRWFRDGDSCKAYRFSYCAKETNVPPFPLKRRRDCEKLCLGVKHS